MPLVKIEAHVLPCVSIGDPRQSKVGEWVAAIGSPFGFEFSMSQGIVSGKGRQIGILQQRAVREARPSAASRTSR
jgi:serine protease Do